MTADHPSKVRIEQANAIALARLIAFADDPNRRKPVGVDPAYDGPEPSEDHMTGREADLAADRYYGDAS